ncbi:MAG: hypothetical protein BZY79_06610 [SAR202 cluster bacterium Casp-Chloro-G4]|nr:sulfite exporter TauE/SafE family protein [Chloroflexota bacterium]MDA1226847.1 sulfite exporter TauE/SafE family protein [Chloroflexota bacterium]PKB60890.1 MAG: hypothetical protein BZY79_06610 [SAR202 cluster bacterium Casp-Chloro-G4]
MFEIQWLWLILMGLGTGIYGVLVGAGGGFILAPLLLIFFHKDPAMVAGTVLALVAVNSISGAITFGRMGIVDKRSAYLFAAAAIPGSVIAPFILKALVKGSPGLFHILFGVILLLLAIRILTKQKSDAAEQQPQSAPVTLPDTKLVRSRTIISKRGQTYKYRFNEGSATAINFVLGFISSFFGIGGGFLRTPILIYGFGFPVQVAVATSIFTLAFPATAGALTHAWLGHVDFFPTFVLAGAGLIVGGQIGAKLTGVVKDQWIMRLLLLVVFILGISLMIQGFTGL